MTLIVDGRRDEIRQYAPELDWISNSFAFLGSIPKQNPSKEVNRVSYRGCMKKVRYDVDATRVLFVNLADQSYGGSVVKTGGDLSYSCNNPSQRSDVLSFTETSSFLELPRWNSLSSGSLCEFLPNFSSIYNVINCSISLPNDCSRWSDSLSRSHAAQRNWLRGVRTDRQSSLPGYQPWIRGSPSSDNCDESQRWRVASRATGPTVPDWKCHCGCNQDWLQHSRGFGQPYHRWSHLYRKRS